MLKIVFIQPDPNSFARLSSFYHIYENASCLRMAKKYVLAIIDLLIGFRPAFYLLMVSSVFSLGDENL